MTTALVVVDMQNAFVAPDGGAAVDGAERAVAVVNRRVAAASARGWPTFYTRDVDPTGRRGPAADHDTALHPGLDVRGIIVDKGSGSAAGFTGFALASTAAGGTPGGGGLSALAGLLREAATDRVLVVGLAADVCVAATARDARRLGYATAIDLDATAFVHAHPDGDDAALADLRAAGVRLEHSTE